MLIMNRDNYYNTIIHREFFFHLVFRAIIASAGDSKKNILEAEGRYFFLWTPKKKLHIKIIAFSTAHYIYIRIFIIKTRINDVFFFFSFFPLFDNFFYRLHTKKPMFFQPFEFVMATYFFLSIVRYSLHVCARASTVQAERKRSEKKLRFFKEIPKKK